MERKWKRDSLYLHEEKSFIRQCCIYLVCLHPPVLVLASRSWWAPLFSPSGQAVQGQGPLLVFMFCKSLCHITKSGIRIDLSAHILGASGTALPLKGHEMQQLAAVCIPHCCWFCCHFSADQDLCWAKLSWHDPQGLGILVYLAFSSFRHVPREVVCHVLVSPIVSGSSGNSSRAAEVVWQPRPSWLPPGGEGELSFSEMPMPVMQLEKLS